LKIIETSLCYFHSFSVFSKHYNHFIHILVSYPFNIQIISHMKIQQLQQNLEMAQQQEIQFKAQMEVRIKWPTSRALVWYLSVIVFVFLLAITSLHSWPFSI